MKCAQTTGLSNRDYLERFNQRAAQQRIPLSGSIDLTHRCNLNCIHCYLKDDGPGRDAHELDVGQWCRILDQIAAAGCLYLLITGGEPLVHKDFSKIYAYAKKKGLMVTVFTNGTRIADVHVDLFKRLPPHAVEISLYGATRRTYEAVTGVRGSFAHCLKGLRKLVDHGIRIRLKTVLMTVNRHEITALRDMAETVGAPFRFDAAVFPRFNGDMAPARLRVDPKEAVDLELSDDKRRSDWQDLYYRMKDRVRSHLLYTCGAGLTTFHVDPCGTLRPCLMSRNPTCNLLECGFKKGWETVIPELRKRRFAHLSPCTDCEKRVLCDFCPPFFELENGAEDRYSDYLCEIGRHRFERIINGKRGQPEQRQETLRKAQTQGHRSCG